MTRITVTVDVELPETNDPEENHEIVMNLVGQLEYAINGHSDEIDEAVKISHKIEVDEV